jgi:hypothetical protein
MGESLLLLGDPNSIYSSKVDVLVPGGAKWFPFLIELDASVRKSQ